MPEETRDTAARNVDLAKLLERTATGDRLAFQALYAATRAKLFGIIVHILYSRDDAAEVLQEVYLRVWRNAATYAPDKGAPMTWLIAIARYRALDWRRRRRPEVAMDQAPGLYEQADDAPSPLRQAMASAEARRLGACLDELEEEQKQCLVLAYRDGLTHQELSGRLDRPLGTIKSWIRRSLARLKECLER